MKLIWTGAAVCLTLALLGSADGGDKKGVDKAKLIGVWEVTKSEGAPPGATVEFTKDGKLLVSFKLNDKEFKVDGTYKLDGNKLDTVLVFEGKEVKDAHTIKTLTDTMLVTVDEKGKVDEFKRKKK
jgi:uncharacterized protein (TIGR03066 family)